MSDLQIYDRERTWLWNLQNSPAVAHVESHSKLGREDWSWCGIPVASPLGVPAGPLLNSGWLLYYASLGFDILVYKTVRTNARDCYELPNLVPVRTSPLDSPGGVVPESKSMDGSWAVSFGMPSVAPADWRNDVEYARKMLPDGKVLIVSVVATQDTSITDNEASTLQLADDFATCAKWAVDAGAHGVEANFSCPNVSTSDGQLYQHRRAAGFVAEKIREQIGDAPLVLKVGHVATKPECRELLESVGPFVSGLAMTNSIPAKVATDDGTLLFDGNARGICGVATRDASVSQVGMFTEAIAESGLKLDIIGVGGVTNRQDVRQYLDAGATSVGIATAAMVNPELALQIRKEWKCET